MRYSDDALRLAKGIIDEHLGIPVELPALVDWAARSLGAAHAGRCFELVRSRPLTARSECFAHVAALASGTRILGERWWGRPHHRFNVPGEWLDGPSPKEILTSGVTPKQWRYRHVLWGLQEWAADDAADALWGRPAGTATFGPNGRRDHVVFPPGAAAGQRLVLVRACGARIDAIVTADADGRRGFEIDDDSYRRSPPAAVDWAWAVELRGIGPLRFPDEPPGGPGDPYGAQIDPTAAREIHSWALKLGAKVEEIGESWTTAGDVITAISRNTVDPFDGPFCWERAAEAIADGEPKKAMKELELSQGIRMTDRIQPRDFHNSAKRS